MYILEAYRNVFVGAAVSLFKCVSLQSFLKSCDVHCPPFHLVKKYVPTAPPFLFELLFFHYLYTVKLFLFWTDYYHRILYFDELFCLQRMINEWSGADLFNTNALRRIGESNVIGMLSSMSTKHLVQWWLRVHVSNVVFKLYTESVNSKFLSVDYLFHCLCLNVYQYDMGINILK